MFLKTLSALLLPWICHLLLPLLRLLAKCSHRKTTTTLYRRYSLRVCMYLELTRYTDYSRSEIPGNSIKIGFRIQKLAISALLLPKYHPSRSPLSSYHSLSCFACTPQNNTNLTPPKKSSKNHNSHIPHRRNKIPKISQPQWIRLPFLLIRRILQYKSR